MFRVRFPFLILLCWLVSFSATIARAENDTVQVYVASRCPHCDAAIRFLREEGIPYEVLDLQRDRRAEATYLSTFGRGILPVISFRNRSIRGFDKLEILRLVKIRDFGHRSMSTDVSDVDNPRSRQSSSPDSLRLSERPKRVQYPVVKSPEGPGLPEAPTGKDIVFPTAPSIEVSEEDRKLSGAELSEKRTLDYQKKLDAQFEAMAEALKEPEAGAVDSEGNKARMLLTCCSERSAFGEVFSEFYEDLYSQDGQVSVDGRRYFDAEKCYIKRAFTKATAEECFSFVAYGPWIVGGRPPLQ